MAEPQHLAQWACEGADAAQAMVRIIQLYPADALATEKPIMRSAFCGCIVSSGEASSQKPCWALDVANGK